MSTKENSLATDEGGAHFMITAGDKIRDNDPRTGGTRVLVIKSISTSHQYVYATHASTPDTKRAPVRIRIDRIHIDGKPRRTGYSLEPRS